MPRGSRVGIRGIDRMEALKMMWVRMGMIRRIERAMRRRMMSSKEFFFCRYR